MARGHTYNDLMWVYPIGLVHEFYAIAIQEERRDRAYQAHLARIASYSSRELSEKGSKQVEKIWTDLLKPLVSEVNKPTAAEDKLQTSNKAASNLFSVGKMHTVTLDKKQE